MLPDFIKVKSWLTKKVMAQFNVIRRSDPLLGRIREIPFHEGNNLSVTTVQGTKRSLGLERFEVKTKLKYSDVIERGAIAYLEAQIEAAKDMADQQKQLLFRRVEEGATEVGNRIDAKGERISIKHYFQMLDKVWVDFDEQGNPKLPIFYANPENIEKVSNEFAKIESDPALKKEFEDLIDKKKAQWNEREDNRKLVD